jgi:hypothetical protein
MTDTRVGGEQKSAAAAMVVHRHLLNRFQVLNHERRLMSPARVFPLRT